MFPFRSLYKQGMRKKERKRKKRERDRVCGSRHSQVVQVVEILEGIHKGPDGVLAKRPAREKGGGREQRAESGKRACE
jgi:hypothetical protein